MTALTPKMVYHQPSNIPENLIVWQDENADNASFTMAAKDIVAGKTVSFAVCTTQPHQDPEIEYSVTIAMGKHGPRFCGENKKPDGAGSSALIATHYDYCKDEASIAVALALTLNCGGYRSFRLS